MTWSRLQEPKLGENNRASLCLHLDMILKQRMKALCDTYLHNGREEIDKSSRFFFGCLDSRISSPARGTLALKQMLSRSCSNDTGCPCITQSWIQQLESHEESAEIPIPRSVAFLHRYTSGEGQRNGVSESSLGVEGNETTPNAIDVPIVSSLKSVDVTVDDSR